MKPLILILFISTLFSCSKEEVYLGENLFFSVDSISQTASHSVVNQDLLQDTIYNNTIIYSNIQDSSRTVLTSSLEDIEIVMGKMSRAGFFQADTQAHLYHYQGNFYSSFIKESQRSVVLRSKYSTNITIDDSVSVILLDNDTSLSVYPVNSYINIAGVDVYPGNKALISENFQIKTDTVTTEEIDFFIKWLTIERVYPLVSAVKERWSFPVLKEFIEEAFVNTSVRHILEIKTRNPGEQVSVIPINIPRGASFKNDTLLWRTSTRGSYVFNFKLVAGRDTATIYRRIRVLGDLTPDVTLYSQKGEDDDFEINFDFSRARSSITGDKALSFKIVSDDINTNWFTQRQKSFNIKTKGKKNFTIYFKTLSGEQAVINRSLVLEDPPVIKAKISPDYIFQHDTITIDLTGTKDDNTPAEKITVAAELIHNSKVVETLHGNGETVFQTALREHGKWDIVLTAHDLGGNRSQKKASVNVGETVSVRFNDVYKGRVNSYVVIPVHATGDNIDSIFVDFTSNGTYDQKGVGPDFRAQAIYSQEGEYKVSIKVTTKDRRSYFFSTKAVIESSPTTLKIEPPKGDLFMNRDLKFKITAENPDRLITSVKCDFNGNGVWDFETQNEREPLFEYSRSGTYKVKCMATTDNGKSVYDSIFVDIKNIAPKINRLKDIAPRVRERVTIKGTVVDPVAKKLEYAWDTNGDGIFDVAGNSFTKRYEEYTTIVFRVMDDDSAFAYDTMNVVICPSDMVLVDNGPYCIDKYEFPNKRYTVPKSNITYSQAVDLCKSQGKRICSEIEWVRACKGKRNFSYPYGNRFDKSKCNVAGNRNRPVEAGNFFNCESGYGAIDMSGNLSEWVSSSTVKTRAYGGSYLTEEFNSSCNSFIELESDKKYFHTGVRCCK